MIATIVAIAGRPIPIWSLGSLVAFYGDRSDHMGTRLYARSTFNGFFWFSAFNACRISPSWSFYWTSGIILFKTKKWLAHLKFLTVLPKLVKQNATVPRHVGTSQLTFDKRSRATEVIVTLVTARLQFSTMFHWVEGTGRRPQRTLEYSIVNIIISFRIPMHIFVLSFSALETTEYIHADVRGEIPP